ncbi:hypothetical protein Mterra_02006 [Calidithermus terrae]|uniref:ABC-2 family transporter protein n=1 Tax=Calidithermus terrae TaxID=1408545 RepID=A0A399EPD7_9DEIN|nr:hypothetical protein [Calidithermus terrae]RIH84362.1 hypothetical protein Mterra_02006 [Calidithermus terrae]
MNALPTLLWLEFRKSQSFVMVLAGVLLLTAVGLARLTANALNTPEEEAVVLFSLAAVIGGTLLVVALFISARQDGTGLLLSVPGGLAHQVARFVYWGLLGAAFALTLAVLLWAYLDRTVPGMPGLGVVLTFVFYGLGLVWLPGVAYLLLAFSYVQSYQLSRLGWLAGLAAFLGFFGLADVLVEAGSKVAYRALPPVTISLQSLGSRLDDLRLPLEPLLLSLALAAGLVALAGRVWDEVEA